MFLFFSLSLAHTYTDTHTQLALSPHTHRQTHTHTYSAGTEWVSDFSVAWQFSLVFGSPATDNERYLSTFAVL